MKSGYSQVMNTYKGTDTLGILEAFTKLFKEGKIAYMGGGAGQMAIFFEIEKGLGLKLGERDIIKYKGVEVVPQKFYDRIAGKICTVIDATIEGEKGRATKDIIKQILRAEL